MHATKAEGGLPLEGYGKVPWRLYLIIGCVGLLLTGILGFGFFTAERMYKTDIPSLDAVSMARLETSRAYLLIEKIANGESFENIESAFTHLDKAMVHLQELDDPMNTAIPRVYPIEDEILQREIQDAQKKLSELKVVIWQRLASRDIADTLEDVNSRYIQQFKAFANQIDLTHSRIEQIKTQNFSKFRATQLTLFSSCIFLTLIVGIAFHRFERRSASDFIALRHIMERLEKEIGERKAAEAALRESDTRFRQIAETIEDIFWLQNTTGERNIIYINPAFETIWRKSAETLYTNPQIFLEPIHPEDADIAKHFFGTFPGGAEDRRTEFRILRPDGSVRWIHARGFPPRANEDGTLRAAGFAQDITGRKRDENRLKELLTEIRNFAAIVSHDLRAPLVNLKGFVREITLVLKKIDPEMQSFLSSIPEPRRVEITAAIKEDLPEALDFIIASASRMESLIQAVLRLSRIEEQRLKLEPIDMNTLIRDILDSFAYPIKQQAIHVSVESLPETRADRFSMEQVFSNLISNAINYLAPDREGEIEIGAEHHPDETIFHVRDNGQGIQPSDLSRIFDIFQRVGTSDIQGEGLGLTFSRSLVRRHGGRIWCDSRFGAGSTFFFSIANRLEDHQNG